MARLESFTILSRSGQTYKFYMYVWGNRFKRLPGVYLVAERTVEPGEEPKYRAIYVGETIDISSISETHEKYDCFQVHYANTIGVLPEVAPEERTSIVFDLISFLRPPCNLRNDDY